MYKPEPRQKVAIVTGAGRGIGREIVYDLCRNNYIVLGITKNPIQIDIISNNCNPYPGRFIGVNIDLEELDQIEPKLLLALEPFSHIDLIVNNAGINYRGTLEPSDEEFLKTLKVNLLAGRSIVKIAKSRLVQPGGLIVFISSVCGATGFAGSGVYCASKFALNGLSESLFNELAPQGINVTTISPSWVATDMSAYADFSKELMIQPSDIIKTIHYLLSLDPQACVRDLTILCRRDI